MQFFCGTILMHDFTIFMHDFYSMIFLQYKFFMLTVWNMRFRFGTDFGFYFESYFGDYFEKAWNKPPTNILRLFYESNKL